MTNDEKAAASLSARQAAGIYEAMSLRYYRRYLEFLHTSEVIAGEAERGRADDLASAVSRYDDLVAGWLREPPCGAEAVAALLDFATLIAVAGVAAETMQDLAIGPEDVLHQAMALNTAARWIDTNVVRPDFTRKVRARLVAQEGGAA